jgi:hypothetical protein
MAAKKRGITRDKSEVFLMEFSRHGSIRKACQVAGVSRAWVREQRLEDDFAINMTDAEQDSIDRVEEKAHQLALIGDDKLIRFVLESKRYKKTTEIDLSTVKPVINITIGE